MQLGKHTMPHSRCHIYSAQTRGVRHAGVNVLVVDDDVNSGEALAAYLASHGAKVRYVDNGPGAIDILKSWLADVAVLDISMPVVDGFATARMIRNSARGQDVTLIAHTALPEALVEKRALVSGFDAYCQKGTSPESLLALVEKATHYHLD
jgi:CheY-like chemotaxis protein